MFNFFVGCHICGALDHKRRECPEKGSQKASKRLIVNNISNHVNVDINDLTFSESITQAIRVLYFLSF